MLSMSPCLLWRTVLGNHYVYSTTDGKRVDAAKKIKNVCSTQRKCPPCNKLLRPCVTSRLRHRQMPLLQTISQSLSSPMLHTGSHQIRRKREIAEIQKMQGGWIAKSRRERQRLRLLGESMQDTGVHVSNLVCAATSNCDSTTCIPDFLDWLRELAQDFKVAVLAHQFSKLRPLSHLGGTLQTVHGARTNCQWCQDPVLVHQ